MWFAEMTYGKSRPQPEDKDENDKQEVVVRFEGVLEEWSR